MDFSQYTDQQLAEAIVFYRRQRNGSMGLNEAAHVKAKNFVRLAEEEQARRLNEAQVKKPTKSERSIALPNGEPDRSADMKVNKVAYALDKEPKKKVSLPKAPWNEEAELDEAAFDDESKAHDRHYEKQTPAVQNALDKYTRQGMSYKQAHAKISNPLTGHRLRKEITPLHEEQIDELKKSTLASYVKKASTDQYLKGQAVQYHTNKAQTADGVFAKQSKEKHYDAADKALKKASNRDTGIGRAVDRLAKEEVELDEAAKEYHVVHRAASLTSAQMKGAVPGDQPTFHKTEADAIAHLNKKYKKVRDGVWKDNKDQFYFHKKKSTVKEEVEQIDELSNTALQRYKSGANKVIDNSNDSDEIKKRVKGYSLASKKLTDRVLKKEEVEQIDEISASTLQSYVDKARDSKKAEMKNRTAAKNDMKKYGMAMDKKAHDDAARKVVNRGTGISVANKKLGTYPADKAKAKIMAREEVELDESDNIRDLFAQSVQAKLKKAKVSYRDPNAKTAREEDRIAKQLAAKAKLKKEEVELDEAESYTHRVGGYYTHRGDDKPVSIKVNASSEKEAKEKASAQLSGNHKNYRPTIVKQLTNEKLDEASYRDSGYANMLKASRKADKEADKMRAKHEKEAKKAGEPKAEFKEEADLRITKIYNKWPKKATYAVHTPDRKYFKEFDSMESAKAHHAEKSGK